MRGPEQLPFRGRIVWLTPEQGGRASGPPPTPTESDYAATAFVWPGTVASGSASFIVRADDRHAWTTTASAGWLVVPNDPPHQVQVGSIVAVTEGARTVAYLHVDEVAPAAAENPRVFGLSPDIQLPGRADRSVGADPLPSILAKALCLLDEYVADRPADATDDDDVKILESVAGILLAVPEGHRERLVALLSDRVARENGFIEAD